MDRDGEFETYVHEIYPKLLRTAILLTADPSTAQDLVQATLEKIWLRWSRVHRADNPDAYTYRTLINTHNGWRRRRWWGGRSYR